jgi:hypothetical protein
MFISCGVRVDICPSKECIDSGVDGIREMGGVASTF